MEKNKKMNQSYYDFVVANSYIREAGTEGEFRAKGRIVQELEAMGLPVELQDFSFPYSEVVEEQLDILVPYNKNIKVAAYLHCKNAAEVEAKIVYVEEGSDFALSLAKGCIALMNGKMNRDLHDRMIKAGVLAYLSITGSPIDGLEDQDPIRCECRGKCTELPGASIHYKDAREIIEAENVVGRLRVEQKKITRNSSNVIASLEGSEYPQEVLAITAHYDSVPQGPGAYDNLSGVAIVLGLAAHFKENRPKRSIKFILFGAEEVGLKGSRAFCSEYKNNLDQYIFCLNVDLAGQSIGCHSMGVTADISWHAKIDQLLKEAGLISYVVHDVCSSDSNSFAVCGVPALTLNRNGFGMHTRHDIAEFISKKALISGQNIIITIAKYIVLTDILEMKPNVPEEFTNKLKNYFGVK